MDQAAWIGNVIARMSALALSLGAPLPLGDIAAALPLLRCVWILAVSCADWMRELCWWTMALRYLHARMAALRVLGPSSAWFFAAVARMSRASSSGDRGGSVLAVLCVGASTSHTGASLVLGRLAGMTNVGCTRHPSKK